MKKLITQEELKRKLLYNPWTGMFYRRTSRRRFVIAGSTNEAGYVIISVCERAYRAHRLAYLHVYGYFPENGIDHRNRIKTANWISNLREASKSCNARNSNTPSDNSSGVVGVNYRKDREIWRAYITVYRKVISLGNHKEFNDAVKARWKAEVKYKFPNCNTSSTAYNYLKENDLL